MNDPDWEELSLGQKKLLEPRHEALEYAERTVENGAWFDPIHFVALSRGKRSKTLDELQPEIPDEMKEELEDDTPMFKQERRWVLGGVSQARRYVSILKEKRDEHFSLAEDMLDDTDVNGYRDDFAPYQERMDALIDHYVGPEDETCLFEQDATEIDELIRERMDRYGQIPDDLPQFSPEIQDALVTTVEQEYQEILNTEPATTDDPSQECPDPEPEEYADTAPSASSDDEATYDTGPNIDWEEYGVDSRDEQRYLEAMARFDADPHTQELDADLLRDVAAWAVYGEQDAPETATSNGTVDEHVQTIGRCLKRNPNLYEGNGAGTRQSRNEAVATARHIADAYLVE